MSDHPMPDYVAALRTTLKSAADDPITDTITPIATSQHRRRTARMAAPLGIALALVVMLLATMASDTSRTHAAYGRPLILRAQATDAAAIAEHFENGVSAPAVLGDGVKFTETRVLAAFDTEAYLVTGSRGWCLAAPDPKLPGNALRSGGVTCARTADINRYGIALAVGGNVIAALPKNATPPTLRDPTGHTETLHPSNLGIVTAEHLVPGTILTLYSEDGDGSTRELHAT